MNFKIAIVDDSATDTEYIAALVRRWAEAGGHTAAVTTFPSAEAFLFQYEDDGRYDILLLDIEMGGMNGVELA